MTDPVVVPRDQHSISRQQIDPDALRVLYRLHQHEYVAYLVGGSVRDLLLGYRPKDFDIGTSAHPYQVKRLFRNCWIVGRRFRLAHVRFGNKAIEVATFRRQLSAEELAAADARPPVPAEPVEPDPGRPHAQLLHHDNTFGTPEEDAFRRDFTINALFYDIGSFSIIDYTGGLADLKAGIIRCIGNPPDRFHEDPVRMLRAVSMASRLNFTIDAPIEAGIATLRAEIARSAPARLTEELYKLLRAGASERAFQMLAERRLLEPIAPQLQRGADERLWQSLAALDTYRRRFGDTPPTLTNAVLLGSLIVPLGVLGDGPTTTFRSRGDGPREPVLSLGMLPLARRDIERLRQILGMQRRLLDMGASPRAKRALMQRSTFAEALTWLELHGHAPDVFEHWRGFIEAAGAFDVEGGEGAEAPVRRRRRRRRRRGTPPAPGAPHGS